MLTLTSAVLTDPGRVRENNEDRAWAQTYSASEGQPVGLLSVCDGIGGNLAGECASHWALEAIKHELADMFQPDDPMKTVRLSAADMPTVVAGRRTTVPVEESQVAQRVRQAIEKANLVVRQYAQHNPAEAAEAGTTVTLALVQGRQVTIGNVGDSRTYRLRQGQLHQITQDHSLVASLVAAGQIRPEEAFSHPQRNVIYRSLGQKDAVQVDVFSDALQPGDFLLLCSDGLWEMLPDPQLITKLVLEARDLGDACQRLVDAANAAGGEDNISVVVAQLQAAA